MVDGLPGRPTIGGAYFPSSREDILRHERGLGAELRIQPGSALFRRFQEDFRKGTATKDTLFYLHASTVSIGRAALHPSCITRKYSRPRPVYNFSAPSNRSSSKTRLSRNFVHLSGEGSQDWAGTLSGPRLTVYLLRQPRRLRTVFLWLSSPR